MIISSPEPKPSAWKRAFPTGLTLARIALAPLIALLLLGADGLVFERGRALATLLSGLAALLFAIATLTDAWDGWLARRWGVTGPLGASLDHAADKVLSMCAALALIATWAPLDVTLVLIVILARDAAIGGLREGLAGSTRAFGIGLLGKAKTVCLLGGLAALITFHASAYSAAPLALQQGLLLLGRGLLYVALGAAVFSAYGYVRTLLSKNSA